jgi:hypothetical protein
MLIMKVPAMRARSHSFLCSSSIHESNEMPKMRARSHSFLCSSLIYKPNEMLTMKVPAMRARSHSFLCSSLIYKPSDPPEGSLMLEVNVPGRTFVIKAIKYLLKFCDIQMQFAQKSQPGKTSRY